jgi:hypothetical protein
LLACLVLLCGTFPGLARAADPSPGNQAVPGALVPIRAGGCGQTGPAVVSNQPPVSVTINPATAWQPRGGEVIVSVKIDTTALAGLSFQACFDWDGAPPEGASTPDRAKTASWQEGPVMVRPSDQIGIVNLGVIVPPLKPAPTSFYSRWFSGVRSTGLGLVPVADMRLIGYTRDGVVFDEVRAVGITSVAVALLVVAGTLLIALFILHRLAAGSPPAGTPAAPVRRVAAWAKTLARPDWILTLVQRRDGRASLSAFQILLWTLVVASSAVYVMTLSGNLINITTGTLTLLGLAGVAGLVAGSTDPPPPKDGTSIPPRWSDLITDPETQKADITRTQMLLFTVVGAAFVIVQVLNYYVIPDIPAGYQILIGISNGVYVGRKFPGGKP